MGRQSLGQLQQRHSEPLLEEATSNGELANGRLIDHNQNDVNRGSSTADFAKVMLDDNSG